MTTILVVACLLVILVAMAGIIAAGSRSTLYGSLVVVLVMVFTLDKLLAVS
jgi:hypothetical protein